MLNEKEILQFVNVYAIFRSLQDANDNESEMTVQMSNVTNVKGHFTLKKKEWILVPKLSIIMITKIKFGRMFRSFIRVLYKKTFKIIFFIKISTICFVIASMNYDTSASSSICYILWSRAHLEVYIHTKRDIYEYEYTADVVHILILKGSIE